MTDVLYPDFVGKTKNYTKEKVEGGTSLVEARLAELSSIEQAIAVALWCQDAGTVGVPHYMAPEKDPA